jgi:hypothetical protein
LFNFQKKEETMTSISSSLTAYTKFLSRQSVANEIKSTTPEEKSTRPTPARPNIAAPVPNPPTDGVRGVKIALNQKSLLANGTAFDLTTKHAQPIKVPPAAPIDEANTTKELQPIKVPPASTEPVTPVDELADQPPVKAPPGGIWTPYDGGFVITMGPYGTAICGPGPSGPFKWPPADAAEEM